MKRNPRRETAYVSQLLVFAHSLQGLFEMMRYDRCFPATEDESRKMMKLLPLAGDKQPSDHYIRLIRVAMNANPPTDRRWESFNCRVLDVRSPAEPPISDEEIKTLFLDRTK